MDLKDFREALQAFKAHNPFISAQLMEVFVLTCLREGRPAQEIENELLIPKSTLSRHLAHLGPSYRRGSEGLRLVRLEENPQDRRSKLVYLTERGASLRDQIIHL